MGCAASANDEPAIVVQQRSRRRRPHPPSYIEAVLALHRQAADVAERNVGVLEGLEDHEKSQLRTIFTRRTVSRMTGVQGALGGIPDPRHPQHLDWYHQHTQDDDDTATVAADVGGDAEDIWRRCGSDDDTGDQRDIGGDREPLAFAFEAPTEDPPVAPQILLGQNCCTGALAHVSQMATTPNSFSTASSMFNGSMSISHHCPTGSNQQPGVVLHGSTAGADLVAEVAPNPLCIRDNHIARNAPTVLTMPTFGAPEHTLLSIQSSEVEHDLTPATDAAHQIQPHREGTVRGECTHRRWGHQLLEGSVRSILRNSPQCSAATTAHAAGSMAAMVSTTTRDDVSNTSMVSRRSVTFCLHAEARGTTNEAAVPSVMVQCNLAV